jgi:predicted metal-dependent hydrolase
MSMRSSGFFSLSSNRVNIDMQQISLGDIRIDVVHKNIKNLHLSVHPPAGRVHISAPLRMDLDTIRVFAVSKLGWIKKQQKKLLEQEREAPRDYINRESHYYLGKRYLLDVIEWDAPPKVVLNHETIQLYVRNNASVEKKMEVMDAWHRQQLKTIIPDYIAKWEKRLKVEVNEFGIKKMKTKWGTCSREAKRIWLNLELAKKPLECLEYIVVHEMAHLIERHHNDRFISLMNHFLPKWRFVKEELNRLPVGHIDWIY